MKIRLINQVVGVNHSIYAVCGRTGKCYGHATLDANERGVVFEMSPEDYERDKFDIVGNTAPMQQWVPQFSGAPDATNNSLFDKLGINALRAVAKDRGITIRNASKSKLVEAIKGLG